VCIGTVAVANELEHMLLQRDFFGWQGWGGISRVGGGHENSSCTLPETNFLPPKIGRANQKEFPLPTIDFQGANC